MSETYIIRATQPGHFVLNYATAQDRTLTWEARGMLVYLLSRPANWKVQPSDLEQGCGRDKVYHILKELITKGYITRTVERDSKGRAVVYVYRVFETPHPLPENQETANPETGKPHITNGESTNGESITGLTPVPPTADAARENAVPVPPTSSLKKQPVRRNSQGGEKAARRDPVFDAIAECLFSAPPQTPRVKAVGGRVAAIRKAIVEIDPDVDKTRISTFWAWYQGKYPNCELKSVEKVKDHYSAWLAIQNKTGPGNNVLAIGSQRLNADNAMDNFYEEWDGKQWVRCQPERWPGDETW